MRHDTPKTPGSRSFDLPQNTEMAVEGEEPEYVSDPEDAVLPSVRRRAASDDEEEEDDDDRGAGSGRLDPSDRRRGGADSDGEGGAPYDDEEEDYEEDYEEEYDEDDLLEEEGEGGQGEYVGGGDARAAGKESGVDADGKGELEGVGMETGKEREREREKEVEPFVVPKAGPFYMHDDRFRENRGFRGRRMPGGGHKLWDSKDDRAWMHDKFEEMNLEDIANDQGRNFRGRYRGRGKSRGTGRGYGRGRKDHAYENRYRGHDDRSRAYGDRSRTYNDRSQNSNERSGRYSDGTKNRTQKILRGRGPRRYEPLTRNKDMLATPSRQMVEARESVSKGTTRNQPSNTSTQHSGSLPPQKQAFSSSLNSASPPFYPSGNSNQDFSMISKRDIQAGTVSRNVPTSFLEENSGPPSKGKVVGFVGPDELLVDNSFHHVPTKNMDESQVKWPSSSLNSASQSTQPRMMGRDFHVTGQSSYHHDSLPNKALKGSGVQPPATQQRPPQGPVQPVLGSQHINSGTVVSSSPHVHTKISPEIDASESPNIPNKLKSAAAGKEKVNNSQSAGPASFLYGGAPIIGANGAMGIAHGTQGFAGTPALLPVMQFCGQNPGGLGVPAVGLALPGYVAQSQPGFGNSEMTWMPALASAGALGASYGTYFAIDGGYYPRPATQVSSSSRDGGASQSVKPSKPPQNSVTTNDEAVQRQNKPRRYSEMNFGQ